MADGLFLDPYENEERSSTYAEDHGALPVDECMKDS